MEILKKPFPEVPQFSSKDIAYATEADALKPFYKYSVTMESFTKVIPDRKASPVDREVLVATLRQQYANLSTTDAVKENIEALLSEKTFTVITAHQPALFTGPLYYIYKIISTIRLVEELRESYSDYQFVPVFISGSEDHDFEEINHTNLFGKPIEWQNEESGACGMMRTDTLGDALTQLKDILGGSDRAQQAYQMIEKAYTRHEKYGDAAQDLVNSLFADYGLVVINMNDAALKRLFIPYLEKEIFEQFSHPYVTKTQQELDEVGFGDQAYAREINIFYLRDQIRARIEQDGEHYQVVDTEYRFTAEELQKEIQDHPERFSPNVVMRPIYQEAILPNLAYIGGGGELSYWLERKSQFEAFGLNFPMLIRRNSALWVDKGSAKKLDKVGLEIQELFEDTEALIKRYVKKNTENEINLKEEKTNIEKTLVQVAEKATEVDPSLKGKVLAENAKIMKSIENLEGRLMKAEKDRFEISLNQIRKIKDKLFPENGLQERHENFLSLYIKYGNDLFEILKEHLNPLEEGMVVFVER
ncbi:MAG TPA: bacillithiol biosynthesis cysteine-adding enzyme BshC [Saprospiraceae bacterium]|nr:bacillithiol biosynthesis cysteine-adding enzyme BshC [Saprospiraceae bacterium]